MATAERHSLFGRFGRDRSEPAPSESRSLAPRPPTPVIDQLGAPAARMQRISSGRVGEAGTSEPHSHGASAVVITATGATLGILGAGPLGQKLSVGPVPIEGSVALVSAVAAILLSQGGQKKAHHVTADIAKAAFAVTCAKWGAVLSAAAQRAVASTTSPAAHVKGVPPEGGSSLTMEELARLGRRGE